MAKKIIYNGRIIKVETRKMKFPDGHTAIFEFVWHKPAVAVIPVHSDGSIMLIRQFRHPVKSRLWEIPAGLIEKNETPLQTAKRELKEETGLHAGSWKKLQRIYSSPGFTDEQTHLFLAAKLTQKKADQDPDEDIISRWFTSEQLKKKCVKGQIRDAKTMLALMIYFQYYEIHSVR